MIGFFDSGFGGLSILKGVEEPLKEYDLVYLGDTKRNPYGNRSFATVYSWTANAVEFLFEYGCEMVIVACHTASNVALRPLQQQYLPQSRFKGRKILGVTIPVVEEACRIADRKIGVLATRATVKSGSFLAEVYKRRPEVEVLQNAAPLLVPFVEEGLERDPACTRVLKNYMRPLKQGGIDTLILGCTHFPLLQDVFEKKAGKSIQVVDSARAVSTKLLDYLKRHPEIDLKLKKEGRREFFTTESVGPFEQIGRRFFGRPFQAKQIQYEEKNFQLGPVFNIDRNQ